MASSKPRTASGTSQSGRVSPVDGSLGVGVGVATGAGTAVGVGVGVGVAVGVGMGVGVAVPVSGVGVEVGVGVAVAGRGVGVDVGSRLVDPPPPPVLGGRGRGRGRGLRRRHGGWPGDGYSVSAFNRTVKPWGIPQHTGECMRVPAVAGRGNGVGESLIHPQECEPDSPVIELSGTTRTIIIEAAGYVAKPGRQRFRDRPQGHRNRRP